MKLSAYSGVHGLMVMRNNVGDELRESLNKKLFEGHQGKSFSAASWVIVVLRKLISNGARIHNGIYAPRKTSPLKTVIIWVLISCLSIEYQ